MAESEAAHGHGDEPVWIAADEVAGDDPQLDPEVMVLASLMWAPTEHARRCAHLLEFADFHRPAAGELYEVVRGLLEAGKAHQPPHVLAVVTSGAQHTSGVRRLLLDATTAGAHAAHLAQYAYLVVSAAHRRGYHAAAKVLEQAATERDEVELFPQLVAIGRERRTAHERLLAARAWAALD